MSHTVSLCYGLEGGNIKGKINTKNRRTSIAGIVTGEEKSVTTCFSPDDDIKCIIEFPMNEEGYRKLHPEYRGR